MSSLATLAVSLADGTVTARALISEAFTGADTPAAAHVFTLRFDEAARVIADVSDKLRRQGDRRPLLGIPVTVKDNFDISGHRTTAGSKLLESAPPALADAAVVQRLRNAGMILIGRTNMTEFAFSGLGLNPHHGTPSNPAFSGEPRIPGGSSAGAAVSVALGIVPAAIGTDTGGSVRIPAAFCGLVGFKASADVISRRGLLPLSQSLDAVGIIACTVADCRTVFEVIRDEPQKAGESRESGIRLAVVRNYVQADITREVRAAFDSAVSALVAAGCAVELIDFPALESIASLAPQASFSAVEAFTWHRQHLMAGEDSTYDPRVVARIRPGAAVDADEYAAMIERRAEFIAAFHAVAAAFDALVWPTVPFIAPLFAALVDDEAYHSTNTVALRNSTIVNLADGCAISLPCQPPGTAPVGLTLAAAAGMDDALLGVAAEIEAILRLPRNLKE